MLKLKRRLFLTIITVTLLASTISTRAAGKCFMWEAQKGKATVYLLGSIHMGNKSMYPLNPAIENAFKKSEYLVLEINPTPAAMKYAEEFIKQHGIYTKGQTLKDNISKTTYNKLNAYTKKKGLSGEVFNMMKPWVIALALLQTEIRNMNISEELGIEKHFIEKVADKPILELETTKAQMELLSAGTDIEQELGLSEALDNLPDTQTQMNRMIYLWLNGDEPGMQKWVKDNMPKSPKLQKQAKMLIDDRNVKMTKKIMEFFKTDKTYFVTVGSAHLTGNKGIVKLLQNNGCKVTQTNKSR